MTGQDRHIRRDEARGHVAAGGKPVGSWAAAYALGVLAIVTGLKTAVLLLAVLFAAAAVRTACLTAGRRTAGTSRKGRMRWTRT